MYELIAGVAIKYNSSQGNFSKELITIFVDEKCQGRDIISVNSSVCILSIGNH